MFGTYEGANTDEYNDSVKLIKDYLKTINGKL